MRRVGCLCELLLLTALLTTLSVCGAQEAADVLAKNKERAIATIQQGRYEHLITQHAATDKAPDERAFVSWILGEINNDSAMRDQIGDELSEIEANGHNTSWLTTYYTREGRWHERASFKASDLRIRFRGRADTGDYNYEVVVQAKDGFHGGMTVKSFKFTFTVRVDYFRFTNAYSVKVTSYPKYEGKTEREERVNAS